MVKKVINYIKKYHMLEPKDRIVVGVSGGADSVCLLSLLYDLSRGTEAELLVVHINHGIRGEEAQQDEAYVQELCSRYHLEFYPFSYDVRRMAAEEGLTEEEAGRNIRYQTFLKVCEEQKCNKIAVAHNKNDNAETVLFHLFRGSAVRGVSGMEPIRKITVPFGEISLIRPLLCVERKEIEAYLRNRQICFQTDSTNLTEDYSRNKIRNRILSYATEQINSEAVGNIHETAMRLREALEYIDESVELRFHMVVAHEKGAYIILVKEFSKEPVVIQKGILRRILEKLSGQQKDLEAKHIDAILSLMEKQVGRVVHLPYQIVAERGYEEIRILRDEKKEEASIPTIIAEPIPLRVPGKIPLLQYRKIVETELIKYEKNDQIPKSSCIKWFDYDKIENAVEIRNRKEGDYIQINPSGGRKKLKDYFIDHKIPKNKRDSQILIADGNHIMWIPGEGERMSEKYKVDETTKNVLLMKMTDMEEN